ncbi:MAG TPA: PSD1 and planctomycete cytochrome C domain-containing protein [Vicinamibacteria bacterium]|nr:PSD1 and planctomycete cytochrome C domain-containing protein [Vicinamibacteria bacterium]
MGMGNTFVRGPAGVALVALMIGGAAASARAPAAAAPEPPVDFVRDVQPILAVCVRCHDAATSDGDLRLDTRQGLLQGGASGPAVISGDGKGSRLYQRLVLADPKKRMPRREDPLPPAQVETVRRWIDQGAPWPAAVVVKEAPAAPTVAGAPESRADPAARTEVPLVSFNKDVRPILADKCFACHGPDRNRREVGLRLDREEGAKLRLPSGEVAIVPGDPERSALIRRVTEPDEEQRMPHVSSGKDRLSAAEIGTLRRWIAQGAVWQPHWSYLPPVRPEPPAVKDTGWPKNPVDAFVLAAIEAEGLAPAPEAPRSDLLRRLSFDLTGLPPTPEELRAFLADDAPGAYERQVDRLLASPRFGERLAVPWLDLVRYADSVGYHSDNPRTVWRYRDYVIGAFNRNLPFDQFTAVQLAGDLLPDPSPEQRIASGYNRLLQTTEEGGAQPNEYRAIYLADRVRNASAVWLAATVGCAQCHDHKFDPYLARDFYGFAAFFADVKEEPVGRRQPDYLPDESRRPLLEAVEAEIERHGEALAATSPALEAAQLRWEKAVAGEHANRFTVLEPVEASSANGTRVLIQGNDFSIIASTASGPHPARDTYTVRFKTVLQGMTAFRLEARTFEELPRGGPGRDAEGGFVVSELVIEDAAGRKLPLRNATASTPRPRPGERFTPGAAVDGRTSEGGWALVAADGLDHRLVVETVEPVGTGEETTLTLVLHQNEGQGRTLGRFRLSATTDAPPVFTGPGPGITRELVEIAAQDCADRTKEQQDTLDGFFRRVAPELAAARAALRAAELRQADLVRDVPQSLVTTIAEPEPVRILPRGNWLDETGEVVEPAVPHFLPQVETGGRRATRLDLARWLTAADNPLTARVFVNRAWKLFFGQGLARSLEDLGSQGEWPTHPELLDWLAVEFRESGWDVKRLLRTLVTTAAYRQGSRPSRELLERDPGNRLYARQARLGLDAEMVRDNALAISGLLSSRLGGPSVRPYQPRGYWSYLNFPPREWDDSPGEDQYRRGIYTWWQRTFPQPSLLAFDAPSREECVAERTRSNVPQQALVLLNDPTYVEAARVFAGRILREGGGRFEDRLRWAYERALSRSPRAEEGRILGGLLRDHAAQYRADPRSAAQLAGAGQAPVPKDLDVVELAGWTSVARAILNLPEVITRP